MVNPTQPVLGFRAQSKWGGDDTVLGLTPNHDGICVGPFFDSRIGIKSSVKTCWHPTIHPRSFSSNRVCLGSALCPPKNHRLWRAMQTHLASPASLLDHLPLRATPMATASRRWPATLQLTPFRRPAAPTMAVCQRRLIGGKTAYCYR